MKKEIAPKVTLRVKFFLICMAEFIAVVLLSELAGWLLKRWLGVTMDIPIFVWAILFSVVMGGAVTNYITHSFIDPITCLGKAMKEVAGGNFHVAMQSDSKLKEVRDIYESFNRMVKELGNTETLQTDFISSVSHEFKTPINAIEGYASLLQDHHQSPEEQETYIEKILFNTRRLSTLTGNILLLSKINNQSIRPQRTAYRLDEQIRQAIVALEQKWTEKNIDFDVELDKVTYSGYESLLLHVWSNFIDNAIKFDPQGGMICLRLRQTGDEVVFTIDDNGPGVAPEEQKRIFHKFYQSDSSREMSGNGLGLALVKQIVEFSGGTVSVENLPEAGCRFTVRLPMQP
jgi:signal transduction histidine kinase